MQEDSTRLCSKCGSPTLSIYRSLCPECRIARTRETASDRFWKKVDKSGECWIWTGSLSRGGYGKFHGPARVLVPSHVFAWEEVNGKVQDGICVLHDCDRNYPYGDISYRRCVRPDHLFVGTKMDNTWDMISKNRHIYFGKPGESNHMSRLTDKDVRGIIADLSAGETERYVAQKYGVVQSHVNNIKHGRRRLKSKMDRS